MNYSQIAILFLQGTLVAFAILLLFRLRRRLGIGLLFACLGLFQFVQVILTSTVYVSITNNFLVSPGSIVFFTGSLFALLIIYIKEDASETKKIIYALFIVNVIMAILLQTLGWNLKGVATHNPFNVSTGLFDISGKVLIVGTIALFLDSLLIIVIFEFLSKRVRFLFLQICLTMLIVVSFDTILFSTLALSDFENLNSIIVSGLASKGIFTIFYSILFYVYLKYFDIKEKKSTFLKTKDVFELLTFKQKFKSAKSEIKKANEMYRILTDYSTDLICLHNPDSTFKYISPSIKNLLGYNQSEFLGKPVFDILHNDDIEPLRDAIEQKGFSSGIVDNVISCRVRHKDGRFIWLEFLISPVFKEKEISYFVSTGRDITEKIIANEKSEKSLKLLDKSEYSLGKASRIAKLGYWEYDNETEIYTWSDYVYRICGLNPKEDILTQKELLNLLDKKSQNKLNKAMVGLELHDIPFDIEVKLTNSKKEMFWIRVIVQPVYNEKNESIGRRGVFQNISESKKVQLELKKSLDLLERNEFSKNKASQLAKIGYWEYDIASDTIHWSDSVYHAFGVDSTEEIPQREKILTFYDEESREKITKATLELDSNGTPYDLELKVINLRKEEVWVRNVVQPIYNKQNEITGRRGVFQDITLLKLRQEELDKQAKELHNLNNALNDAQQMAHVGGWFHDVVNQKSEWSEETFRIWGYDLNEPVPEFEEIVSRIHKDDLDTFYKATELVFNEGISYDIEYRICLDNDEVKTVRSICKPILADDGSLISLNGTNQDITDRKVIEEENLRIKNNYRSLFDNATISIWNEDLTQVFKEIEELRKLNIPDIKIYLEQNPKVLLSLTSKVIVNSVNKATLKLYKAKSNQDFLNNIEATFGKDADKVFIKLIESIWNNKKSFISEVNYKKLNGDEFVALFSIPIPQTKLEQKTVPISIQNIQNLKDAESAKRESIKDLNAAQELANVGSWRFDVSTKVSKWSDETFRIWGFKINEIAPSEEDILNRIHVDDRASFLRTTDLIYSEGASYDIEYRICLPNNEEKWIRSICRTILDDNGNVVLLKGINQDITEKKRATEEIEKAEELYRLLTDHSNDIICLQEPDSTFKYMSPSIKKVLGFEPSEFIGKQIFSIVHNDDIQSLKDAIEQKVFSREIAEDVYSFRARHKDGHFVWLEYLTSPVYIEDKISYFVTSARDITQRVEANELIKTSLELLKKSEDSKDEASEIAKIGYWEYNFVEDTFIWSDYIYRIYGLDPKDDIPSELDLVALYDEESQEKIAKLIQGIGVDTPSADVELKFTNFKNEEVWERSVVQPIYNKQNEVVGRRGVMQDITDTKNAQFELELSRQEIETSLNLLEKSENAKNEASKIAKIGYWENDIATNDYIWSDYIYHIFGVDPKEEVPPGEEIVSLFDKESQEKMAKSLLELDSNGTPVDIELKLINFKNEVFWVRNVAQAVYNDQNEIVGRRGVTQDITDSKKAQLELENSKIEIENSLSKLERSEFTRDEASKVAKIGYHEYDVTTDTFVWSDYVYHIFGFDPKEGTLSREVIINLLDVESQEKMVQATLDINLTGNPYDVELKLVNLRGEEVWVRLVVQPVYNDENKIVKRRGVLQDITDSKKAQLELENSLHKLEKSEFAKNEASKIAKIGYWEQNIVTNDSIWSDYIYHIFGVDLKEEFPSREEYMSLFDKDSQQILVKALLDLDSNGISFDVELKLTNLKNEVFWIRSVGQAVYNDQNEIVGKRGVTQDISDSKKAQLELELSKQEIETSLYELEKSEYTKNEASKVAKIGYHEYDIATDLFIWSEHLYDIFGFDKSKRVPPREEIVPLFDAASQKKMKLATLDLDLKGIPYDLELKIINLKGEEVWVRNIAEAVYNDQNEIVGRRGITQNITSSKKAQLDLEFSKEQIQTSLELLENSEYSKNEASKVAKIGYHEYEIATDTFIWSDYVYRIFGFDKKNGVPSRKDVMTLFDKESREIMKQATLDIDLKGTSYDLELRLINRRKRVVWIRIIAQSVYNDQNEIVGRRGILQDITVSKNAQFEIELSKEEIQISLEKLGKSERSKNEASKMAKMGHLEYDMESDTFTWSDYLYEFFGFDPKEEIPPRKEILAFFDQESQKKISQSVLELETNGTSYDIELKFINQRKEAVWARSVSQPVYNEQNEITGRRGTLQNITAFKVAQLALEASREEIKTSLKLLERSEYSLKESGKVAKIAFHGIDIATHTLIWSDYVYEILGFDIKDGVPSREEVTSIIDKENMKILNQANSNLMSTGNSYDIELKIFNSKKNEEVWVRNVVQPVYNDQNEIVGRRGVMQDITDRKKIEAEHLRIKDNYRRLFENATISIWNEDLTEVFKEIDELRKLNIPNIKIYLEEHPEVLLLLLEKVKVNTVNKATLELFKAKNYEQFLGNIQDTFGEGAYEVFATLLEAIWNKEKTFTAEVNFKTLKGDEFLALFSVSIPQTRLEQKSVPASIQSIQSIKDAELEKRKSLKKLKEAEKLANVGSWVFDVSARKSTWSEEMFYIWGFDLNNPAPKLETLINRIHKDDVGLFIDSVDKAISKGTPYDIEFRISIPNNKQKWIRGICQPKIKDNGDVFVLTGSNQDVTSRREATEEIEKAEEMYRLLADHSYDLICLQDPDSTFRYISPSIKTLLGYEPSELIGEVVFGEVHPDDVVNLKDSMEVRMKNDTDNAVVFRVRHKQGHFVWLESLSSPIFNGKEINSFVTSSRDITEWMLAKKEIEEYQISLQKMTTEMTLIEEKQKKEIASNIHDHLSQSLVISKMKINELKKKSELENINEGLTFIESHISEALENSRKITYELSPPVLYQLGIIDALIWLLEDVETTHKIECVVDSNVSNINMSDANSILLYRCLQEVVKNAVKYANASLLTLNLDKNNIGISIVLTDNGGGFDTSTLNDYQNHSGSGFGLFAVQERVKNIQGEFTITSEINSGTSVKIFIPLAV